MRSGQHGLVQPTLSFDGATYEPSKDQVRLTGQWLKVFHLMSNGRWWALDELCWLTGINSQASVSARIRDFRKQRFGAHQVERKRVSGGLYAYRLIVNKFAGVDEQSFRTGVAAGSIPAPDRGVCTAAVSPAIHMGDGKFNGR